MRKMQKILVGGDGVIDGVVCIYYVRVQNHLTANLITNKNNALLLLFNYLQACIINEEKHIFHFSLSSDNSNLLKIL